jgi:hypothetical protein
MSNSFRGLLAMAQPPSPGPPNSPPERSGTVLETDEDIRQACTPA